MLKEKAIVVRCTRPGCNFCASKPVRAPLLNGGGSPAQQDAADKEDAERFQKEKAARHAEKSPGCEGTVVIV